MNRFEMCGDLKVVKDKKDRPLGILSIKGGQIFCYLSGGNLEIGYRGRDVVVKGEISLSGGRPTFTIETVEE